MVYYAHHYGWNQHERDKYRNNINYQSCVDFCEQWDQASFDPAYPSESLEYFEPYVRRLFARRPYNPVVMQPGVVKGLPRVKQAAE
jgi:predicted HD phosphohydrolase